MSLDALNWAGRQLVGTATGKSVLRALAHCANGSALAWPSVAELVAVCEIHRKGVLRELAKLKRSRLIEDTGERRGRTSQIKVWKLAVSQESLALRGGKRPPHGTLSIVAKGPAIRDSLNGHKAPERVPPGKRFPSGPERVPREGHGTIKELDSVANATGGEPAADPVKTLFDLGVALLVETGQSEASARSLLGKFRKSPSDAEVLDALLDCRARALSNPAEWLTKRLRAAKYVSESGFEYRGTLEQIRRKADERNDRSTYWAVEREIRERAEAKGGR